MKRIGLCILGIILFSSYSSLVLADNITYQRLNNINYNLTVDGKTSSNHVTKFYLDGRLAYCIEPGTDITTKNYNSSKKWSVNFLTNEQQYQIEKIGYYGFEYPSHQTDRYYIATQELIWQTVKKVNIKWTNDNGTVIDVSKEKNEIMDLVNKHDVLPSFTNDSISAVAGSEMEVVDNNNVLSNFTLSGNNKHNIKLDNNKITIKFSDELVEEKINLKRKKYDGKALLVYQYPNSQTLAALRLSANENLSFTVKSVLEEKPKETPKEIVQVPSTFANDSYFHTISKVNISAKYFS